MKEPKFCRECVWSAPEENFSWNLRCDNPTVNSKDPWALSGPKITGTSTREERSLKWYRFPACGMVGKLWEEKFDIDSLLEN